MYWWSLYYVHVQYCSMLCDYCVTVGDWDADEYQQTTRKLRQTLALLTSEFSIPLINVHLTLVYVCDCCSSDQYNIHK